jgi:imidazole glycerol-phosphate synthase subunit HisH
MPLRERAAAKLPIVGICLGMQLLLTESYEFGIHKGLGIIDGDVIAFENPCEGDRRLKVPQVGWNKIYRPKQKLDENICDNVWEETPLRYTKNGEYMYFVHSYYVKLDDPALAMSMSQYGNIDFCSGLKGDGIYAFQFHPERSGSHGLEIYRSIKEMFQPL